MALIAPSFLDSVVSIGVLNQDNQVQWIASGFLYGDYITTTEDKKIYEIYLVTNRHVIESLNKIVVRFSSIADLNRNLVTDIYLIDPASKKIWASSGKSDVAVIKLNGQLLLKLIGEFSFFKSDADTSDVAQMKDRGHMEGDGVFLLGFPLNLVDINRNLPIARKGIIARVRDCLAGTSETYLLDVSNFPGNSGGPVVNCPEFTAINGTKSQEVSRLIGIVCAYVPYRDIAISSQTKNVRAIFEENSNIAVVYPVDAIKSCIDNLKSRKLPDASAEKVDNINEVNPENLKTRF